MNAIAVVKSPQVNGTIRFHQCEKHVTCVVTIDMKSSPNAIHAIHIHEWGDLTDGCKSLGGHYNPLHKAHGSIFNIGQERHAGDLINNMYFDGTGRYYMQYDDPQIHVPSIYGRSVVIHSGKDDIGLGGDAESLKTGNAGSRLTCALIGRKE